MMRYARDYDTERGGRNFGGINRAYDMDYNTGYRGMNNADRGRDWNENRGGRYGINRDRSMGGYDMDFRGETRMRGGREQVLGRGERVVFGPQHGYDRDFGNRDFGNRDFGDRLQSGWNRVERNVRDFFDRDDNYRR